MLDVSDILKHNIEVSNKEIELDIKEIEYDYNILTFDKPLIFKGSIHNVDKILNVVGIVEIEFDITCYLCYEKYRHSQIIQINEIFRQSPNEEEYNILSDKIDLEKAVIDNIILQLPTRFVCIPECRGICQVCGKNKNIEQCNCKNITIDPRLEKLKDLL